MAAILIADCWHYLDSLGPPYTSLAPAACNPWTASVFIPSIIFVLFYAFLRSRKVPVFPKQEVNRTRSHLPVLIVGAGPTGLTLAHVLTRYGVPFQIIEQNPHLSRTSKATNVMQRNQELMYALGLLDALNETGGQMRRLMVHAYGKCFGPRTMRLKETPFSDVILCGQHNFERVLAEGLNKLGVKIDYHTRLLDLYQEDGLVTAKMSFKEKEEISKFSYVVGCDGYDGASRRFTNLQFEIVKTGVAIRQMWLFYFDHGFAAVIPLPGDIHRVICIEPKTSFPNRKPTLEEMQTKLRQISDDGSVLLSDADWFSYTDLSMGIAPALQDERIILAGDVGNPILPNGGQGMNTGISDAYNLGWKLTAVYKHGAPHELLATYNTERYTLRSELQKAQFNSLKYTTLVTPKPIQAAFRWFVEPILDAGFEYKMAQIFSELSIHTRDSPLSINADRQIRRGSIRAGDRALDSPIVQDFDSTRLYAIIYRGTWTLLAFCGRGNKQNALSIVAAIRQLGRSDLSSFMIMTENISTSLRLSDEDAHVLYDMDEEAHRIYGIFHPSVLLVRPDGYVAVRIQPNKAPLLKEYLQAWLPDASQKFADFPQRRITKNR